MYLQSRVAGVMVCITVAAVALTLVPGCSKSKESRNDQATKANPLTETECTEWARKVERSVKESQGQFIHDSIDFEALAEKTARAMGLQGTSASNFEEGFINAALKANVGKQISDSVGAGHFRLVHVQMKEGGQCRALFRGFDGSGLLYDGFDLCRGQDGSVRVEDIQFCAIGQTFSEMAGQIGMQASNLQEIESVKKFGMLVKSGQHKEALTQYATLPAKFQKLRSVLVLRIQAAAGSSEEVYVKAMEDFRTSFPDDPAADLVSLDWFFLKNRFSEAYQCIDRLDKTAGGDPFLDYYRATCAIKEGQLEKAKGYAKKVVAVCQDLEDPYWLLISIDLKTKDYKGVSQLLAQLEKELGIKIGDLKSVGAYADYVKSPEYEAWMTSRHVATAPTKL